MKLYLISVPGHQDVPYLAERVEGSYNVPEIMRAALRQYPGIIYAVSQLDNEAQVRVRGLMLRLDAPKVGVVTDADTYAYPAGEAKRILCRQPAL